MSSKNGISDNSSNLSSDPVTQIKRIVLKRRPVTADEEGDAKESKTENNLNASISNSNACENGVSQTEDNGNSDCSTSVISTESVTKKRGRKKKIIQEEHDSTCDMSDNENGSTRQFDDGYAHFISTTIKVEPEDSEITIVNEDLNDTISRNLPEKKKRGRPKKIRDSFDNDNENRGNEESKSGSSVSSVEKIIKRGRGRPRKSDVSQMHSPCPQEESSTTDVQAKHASASDSASATGRRKIIKPRRFGSYESFEFMDVSIGDTSRRSTRAGDRQAHTPTGSFQITQIEDDDEDDDDDCEERKKLPKTNDADDDSKSNKSRKRRIMKLALGRDEENEFDAFGKNVALQLKEVSLQDALELQIQILSLISDRRLRLLGRENASK